MRSLTEFERATLAHRPTALEPMPNISVDLDGPDVWVKRGVWGVWSGWCEATRAVCAERRSRRDPTAVALISIMFF